MSHVVEIVVFRLKPDSDTAAFLNAAQATFDLLADYDGYKHRELSVSEEGWWTDVVHWATMETALSAADQLMTSPVGQAFGDFIDPATISMYHVHPKLQS
jgi:hypothetical protein